MTKVSTAKQISILKKREREETTLSVEDGDQLQCDWQQKGRVPSNSSLDAVCSWKAQWKDCFDLQNSYLQHLF